MRPRRAVLLTPPSLIPAFFQNVAKSCICHTSENSPVTPIIATDPKMRSCKSCVCHTCDPLPRPQSHPLLFQFVAAPHCKFAPLFSSSCKMLPPATLFFSCFCMVAGGGRGQAQKACSRPHKVLFQESLQSLSTFVPRIRRSRVRGFSHFASVTTHESPDTSVVLRGFSRSSGAVSCELSAV